MIKLDRLLSQAETLVVPCVGVGHPSSPGSVQWTESSRLGLRLPEEEVVALARRFEQWAVFRWTPTTLDVVGVLANMNSSSGWSLDRPTPPSRTT